MSQRQAKMSAKTLDVEDRPESAPENPKKNESYSKSQGFVFRKKPSLPSTGVRENIASRRPSKEDQNKSPDEVRLFSRCLCFYYLTIVPARKLLYTKLLSIRRMARRRKILSLQKSSRGFLMPNSKKSILSRRSLVLRTQRGRRSRPCKAYVRLAAVFFKLINVSILAHDCYKQGRRI